MIKKKMRDLSLIQQVLLERLKSGYEKAFEPELAELKKKYRELILSHDVEFFSEISKRDLNLILAKMDKTHGEVLGGALDDFMKGMPDLAGTVAEMEAAAIGSVIVGTLEVKAASAAVSYAAALAKPIQATGNFMVDFVKEWPGKDIEHINGAVRNGWASGKTLMQMVRELNSQVDGKTKTDLGMVIATATQNVATHARFETYSKNPKIVKEFQWLSTLDRRTCPLCQPRDLQIFPLDYEPKPGKVHMRCRCSSSPVLDKKYDFLQEGATRASSGPNRRGEVSANEDYYTWIKSQPQEYQELALGVKRSQLLRDGGLTASKFRELNIGRDFEPMTLDEMKDKAPAAFKRAGL